jgi:4-carboxymuconolactone decarboxylase
MMLRIASRNLEHDSGGRMRSLFGRVMLLLLLALICVPLRTAGGQAKGSEKITITHQGSRTVTPGPADHFDGDVRLELLADPTDPSRIRAQLVTFARGSRTAWHSHPLGQILIVTQGTGYVQQWGGPVQEIHPGDVIWTPPNQKHWHGAGPNGSMAHYALYDQIGDNGTKWMDKVSDEEYKRAILGNH